MNPFTFPTDEVDPLPPPSTISPQAQFRLLAIKHETNEIMTRLHELTAEALAITREEDLIGHTADLIWASESTVAQLLERLNITVEDGKA